MKKSIFIYGFILYMPSISINADNINTSGKNWGYYIDSCTRLDSDFHKIEKKLNTDPVFIDKEHFTVKFHIDRMDRTLKNVTIKDKNKKIISECNNKINDAQILFKKIDAHNKNIKDKNDKKLRKEHLASPLYKHTIDLGFKDYGWLSDIHFYIKEISENELKKWIFYSSDVCGKYYRISQYVKPYIIYRQQRKRFCGGQDQLAVLPLEGATFRKGDYLRKGTSYVFSGVLEAQSTDGFPVRLFLLKQISVNNKKYLNEF